VTAVRGDPPLPPTLAGALARRAELWREPRLDVGALDAGWTTAAAFFADSEAVEDWLAYQDAHVHGLDDRGRAAALITDYSYMFALAVVPLLVGWRMVPDLSPAKLALRFDVQPVEHDGALLQQRRLQVRFLGGAFRTDRADAAPGASSDTPRLQAHFRGAVEGHFRPFVAVLHARSRLSRSALWRLVADSLAAVFLDAGQRCRCKETALAEAAAILKAEGSPLNNRQLHFFDITLCAGDDPERILLSRTFRSRGGCCRFYTAEGGRLCSTCVLKDQAERDRGIVDALCRRLGLPAAGTRFRSQIHPG
jgi:hypothetical protein